MRSQRRIVICVDLAPSSKIGLTRTNMGECEAVCPKGIKLENIALMKRHFLGANWAGREGVEAD